MNSDAAAVCNHSVYVILLNWNGWRDTLECLESLSEITHHNTHIIVVDNASEDDSVCNLKKSKTQFDLLQATRNLGFSGGNNLGISMALDRGADYILLLNNDTVVAKNIVDEFLAVAQSSPRIGAVGAKIYYLDTPTLIWYAGGSAASDKFDCPGHRGGNELDVGLYEEVVPTSFINGCAFFIKASAIREIGMLDEDYFYMFEDVDWTERLYQSGYECLYAPKAIVYHKTHRSTNGSLTAQWRYFYERNRLLWLNKRHPEVPLASILCHRILAIVEGVGVPFTLQPPFIKKNYFKEHLFPAIGMVVGIIDYLRGYRAACPRAILWLDQFRK